MEERHQQQETMRRENRRVQAMSWGLCLYYFFKRFLSINLLSPCNDGSKTEKFINLFLLKSRFYYVSISIM